METFSVIRTAVVELESSVVELVVELTSLSTKLECTCLQEEQQQNFTRIVIILRMCKYYVYLYYSYYHLHKGV